MRQVSQAGVELVKRFEGFSPKPYLCPAGRWTIGYGTTSGITKDSAPVTEAEAERLLRSDMAVIVKRLDVLLPSGLSQHQFDAVVSFCYNLGLHAFEQSTLRRVIERTPSDYARVRQEFGRWVHAGGVRLDGLVKRRAAEADLYCGKAG